jgi:hypothetical protein
LVGVPVGLELEFSGLDSRIAQLPSAGSPPPPTATSPARHDTVTRAIVPIPPVTFGPAAVRITVGSVALAGTRGVAEDASAEVPPHTTAKAAAAVITIQFLFMLIPFI